MKNEINTLCDKLFEILTEDFENETDYPEDTAKVFDFADKIEKLKDYEIAEILDIDAEDDTTASIVRAKCISGCNKWLTA